MAYQGIAGDIAAVMAEVIDSQLLASLCTIQQPAVDGSGNLILDSSGAPSGTFTDEVGLIDIPCMKAPPNTGSVSAQEARSLPEIETRGLFHVMLNGYYPTVVANWPKGRRAVVDGTAYNIRGAEPDSQMTQTRLDLELVGV